MTSTPPPAPDRGPEPSQWATAVREVVRLRREESAADSAEEDAMAADLHRAFRESDPAPDGGRPSTP